MENLFAALTHDDSIAFLISILIAFLIGFITAWVLWGGRASRFRREAKKWKGSYDAAQTEQQALRQQLDLKDADLVKSQRETEELAAHIRIMEEEKAKWQADLDAATAATAQANSNARSYAATIEDLNNQILGLKARLSQQEKDGGKSAETQSQVAEMKTSYDATVTRLNALEEKISQLLTENAALRAQKESGTSRETVKRLSALEGKLNDLIAENEGLRSELSAVKNAAKAAVEVNVEVPGNTSATLSAKEAVLGAIGTKIPAAKKGAKDDLTLIRGIGSFLEKKLNGLGISTFEQISRFDSDMMDNVATAIEFFPGRIQRDDWVGQAARLMEIKTEQPEALAKTAIFPNNPQDLKIVEGIGPKIEKLLKKAGIGTWEDLAKAKKKTLQKVISAATNKDASV
ncbi:MAG: helix-hairpin-helix domain-containing protein, partial [Saprospiraceae bacterium]